MHFSGADRILLVEQAPDQASVEKKTTIDFGKETKDLAYKSFEKLGGISSACYLWSKNYLDCISLPFLISSREIYNSQPR